MPITPKTHAAAATELLRLHDWVTWMPEVLPVPSIDVYSFETPSAVRWHDGDLKTALDVAAAYPDEWEAHDDGALAWINRPSGLGLAFELTVFLPRAILPEVCLALHLPVDGPDRDLIDLSTPPATTEGS